ncbi:hypothetical protein D3C80_1529840 [compost metagenome]
MNLGRQARLVETVEGFFIGKDIAPPRLGFQFVQLLEQAGIGRQALGPRLDLAAHQAFSNEQLPRKYRLDGTVVHGPAPNHDQAVQRDLLVSHHLPALFLPVRFEVVFLDQMPGEGLDPVRFDLRHHACIKLGGLHQLGGH